MTIEIIQAPIAAVKRNLAQVADREIAEDRGKSVKATGRMTFWMPDWRTPLEPRSAVSREICPDLTNSRGTGSVADFILDSPSSLYTLNG